jgi:hypothetical protein
MFTQRAFDRRRFLGTAALSVAAPWIGTRDSVLRLITVERFRIPSASDLASLGRAMAWLNSAPLTADGLRGKVVLVDFWTYTCINWLPRSRHRSVAQSVGLQDWSCYARLKHFKRSVVYADDRPLLRWLCRSCFRVRSSPTATASRGCSEQVSPKRTFDQSRNVNIDIE